MQDFVCTLVFYSLAVQLRRAASLCRASLTRFAVLPTATKSKNAIIQVKNVVHFAYGAYANGDVDFWAAGLAGWHCIKPADSYTAIFHDMIEAVHIFYFIADSYGSEQRPRWDELFTKVSPSRFVFMGRD